jgi:hypothetical protein
MVSTLRAALTVPNNDIFVDTAFEILLLSTKYIVRFIDTVADLSINFLWPAI